MEVDTDRLKSRSPEVLIAGAVDPDLRQAMGAGVPRTELRCAGSGENLGIAAAVPLTGARIFSGLSSRIRNRSYWRR